MHLELKIPHRHIGAMPRRDCQKCDFEFSETNCGATRQVKEKAQMAESWLHSSEARLRDFGDEPTVDEFCSSLRPSGITGH